MQQRFNFAIVIVIVKFDVVSNISEPNSQACSRDSVGTTGNFAIVIVIVKFEVGCFLYFGTISFPIKNSK